MQILIPMAGSGSRFQTAGFDHPKPFIEFLGKTMIEHVIDNLGRSNDFIVIMQREHYQKYTDIVARITQTVSSFEVVLLDGVTKGAAKTCLLAKNKLDMNSPLMIANCDQLFKNNLSDFSSWFLNSTLDGVIMTFDSQSNKNSYVELDDNGLVKRVVEKQVISRYATTGIYVWRKARDFIDAAEEMIISNDHTNGEFYVAPTYNYNIRSGHQIGTFYIKYHYPIGTPVDLHRYMDLICSGKSKL